MQVVLTKALTYSFALSNASCFAELTPKWCWTYALLHEAYASLCNLLQARPSAAQVLTVNNTAPLPATPRAVVGTASEPVTAGYSEPVGDGQLDATSLASLTAMAQSCQAADA